MSFPPPPPSQIDTTTLGEPVYRGSVQYLYAVPDHPSYLVCQTTEAGSVFDVGSIFHIEGHDLSRALFRHAMYTRLAEPETWLRVKAAIQADQNLDADWKAALLTGPLEGMIESGARTHHVGIINPVDLVSPEDISVRYPGCAAATAVAGRGGCQQVSDGLTPRASE